MGTQSSSSYMGEIESGSFTQKEESELMMSQPRFVILRLICLCAVIVGVIIIATTSGSTIAIIISSVVGFFMIKIALVILKTRKDGERRDTEAAIRPNSANAEFLACTVDKFLNDIEKDEPVRFTTHQLMLATNNYTNKLGSGGFGAVYRGVLVDGSIVAVKVLHEISDHQRIEDQFMAEVGTIGRVHHLNLVRLFGFCFENNMRALVYEYMSNGSLDKYLFCENNILAFQKLHEIAVRTAKGIAYLHEECQQRIIHYDIKPENILLDQNFCPKVADFSLAKIFNREKSHVTMTGLRGTPGYAAPDLWLPFPVTHRCDVYSFGMLLFEIIGRRRNHDMNLPESQEWFPREVWTKFNSGELEELTTDCGMADKEIVERMSKVALWCVQYRPELRPMMSVVAKMLETLMDIPNPSNPFRHLMDEDHSIHSSN